MSTSESIPFVCAYCYLFIHAGWIVLQTSVTVQNLLRSLTDITHNSGNIQILVQSIERAHHHLNLLALAAVCCIELSTVWMIELDSRFAVFADWIYHPCVQLKRNLRCWWTTTVVDCSLKEEEKWEEVVRKVLGIVSWSCASIMRVSVWLSSSTSPPLALYSYFFVFWGIFFWCWCLSSTPLGSTASELLLDWWMYWNSWDLFGGTSHLLVTDLGFVTICLLTELWTWHQQVLL